MRARARHPSEHAAGSCEPDAPPGSVPGATPRTPARVVARAAGWGTALGAAVGALAGTALLVGLGTVVGGAVGAAAGLVLGLAVGAALAVTRPATPTRRHARIVGGVVAATGWAVLATLLTPTLLVVALPFTALSAGLGAALGDAAASELTPQGRAAWACAARTGVAATLGGLVGLLLALARESALLSPTTLAGAAVGAALVVAPAVVRSRRRRSGRLSA